MKAMECVVDTNVLQKANATLKKAPKEGRDITKRLHLLRRIGSGELKVLFSPQLLAEYNRHITPPRNDLIKSFLELITSGQRAIPNWPSPWRTTRLQARQCRFPEHDDHVLRTAIRRDPSTIFTEEGPMLATADCIYRRLSIRIVDPRTDTIA